MSTRLRLRIPAFILLSASLLPAAPAAAGSWTALSNYGGSNTMSVYQPTTPEASPAIVVSLHYCGGQMSNAQGWFQSYADKYGFLIIAGKSTGSCWDASLGRSGERDVIVQAVNYVIKNHKGDKSRVFTAGASSGACMTQALLASYPDVFVAGASLAGVPAGAWTGRGEYGWSASGSTTAQQWGDKVRQADPGFSGNWPRIQLWQGQGDTTLTYAQAYPAQVSQWTNVFGVTDANATTTSIKPTGASDTWSRTSYKNSSGVVVVEANSGPGSVSHDLTGRGLWADVVRFFGLDGSGAGGSGGSGGSAGTSGSAGATGAGGGSGTSRDAGVDRDGGPAGGSLSGGTTARSFSTGDSAGASGAVGGLSSGGARTVGTSEGGTTATGGNSAKGGSLTAGGTSGNGGEVSSGGRMQSGGNSASSSASSTESRGGGGASAASASKSDSSSADDRRSGGSGCMLAGHVGRSGSDGTTILILALGLILRFGRRKRR